MKKLSILIPNATSSKNLGDAAMLFSFLSILKTTLGDYHLTLHTFNPELYHKQHRENVSHTLYSWAVFAPQTVAGVITRLIPLFAALVWVTVRPNQTLPSLFPQFLKSRFEEYENSDAVILAPGGYLRTQKGVTQTLNLLMQLVPLSIAKKLQKKVIVAPVSVGPFAHRWQEQLAVRLLRTATQIFVREEISLNLLTKYGLQAELAYDLALSLPQTPQKALENSPVAGFVIRKWYTNSHKQLVIEQSYVAALEQLFRTQKVSIQPIVHVNAPEYGEIDLEVTRRVMGKLQRAGVRMKPLVVLESLSHARQTYRKLGLLVSMRLHGAIIAGVEGIPSVVVGYEHKAPGIFAMLGLSDLVVPVDSISPTALTGKVIDTWKKRNRYQKVLVHSLKEVQNKQQQFQRSLQSSLVTSHPDKKRKKPSVTVAISAYNEAQNIGAFVNSVLNQRQEGYILKKILVVSDGSGDKTVKEVQRIRKTHRLKRLVTVQENLVRKGKSLRLNQIYTSLSTDYLVQSDADVVLDHPLVIRDLVSVFESRPRVGMCGGNPLPLPATTFIEQAINSTVEMYIQIRSKVRGGHNAFSADGRLLAFRRDFAKTIRIPHDMIANDRYTYYVAKSAGWGYAFVPSAVVRFRSPQTVRDHIRQNTRFVAAPIRMRRYFPSALVAREESIPVLIKIHVLCKLLIRYPVHIFCIVILNRYCEIRAHVKEHKLTATWDMAKTTKKLIQV